MTTGMEQGGGGAAGRYALGVARIVVAAMLVSACRTPAPPVLVPQNSPTPAASVGAVASNDRLEFRLADSVAFPGSEATPRRFDGRSVYAAQQAIVGTSEFRSVAAQIDEMGMPVLTMVLCPEAGARLLRITAARVGRQLMIISGNDVLSVAVITGAFGERVQVAGLGTVAATKAFADTMQSRLSRQACAG